MQFVAPPGYLPLPWETSPNFTTTIYDAIGVYSQRLTRFLSSSTNIVHQIEMQAPDIDQGLQQKLRNTSQRGAENYLTLIEYLNYIASLNISNDLQFACDTSEMFLENANLERIKNQFAQLISNRGEMDKVNQIIEEGKKRLFETYTEQQK